MPNSIIDWLKSLTGTAPTPPPNQPYTPSRGFGMEAFGIPLALLGAYEAARGKPLGAVLGLAGGGLTYMGQQQSQQATAYDAFEAKLKEAIDRGIVDKSKGLKENLESLGRSDTAAGMKEIDELTKQYVTEQQKQQEVEYKDFNGNLVRVPKVLGGPAPKVVNIPGMGFKMPASDKSVQLQISAQNKYHQRFEQLNPAQQQELEDAYDAKSLGEKLTLIQKRAQVEAAKELAVAGRVAAKKFEAVTNAKMNMDVGTAGTMTGVMFVDPGRGGARVWGMPLNKAIRLASEGKLGAINRSDQSRYEATIGALNASREMAKNLTSLPAGASLMGSPEARHIYTALSAFDPTGNIDPGKFAALDVSEQALAEAFTRSLTGSRAPGQQINMIKQYITRTGTGRTAVLKSLNAVNNILTGNMNAMSGRGLDAVGGWITTPEGAYAPSAAPSTGGGDEGEDSKTY